MGWEGGGGKNKGLTFLGGFTIQNGLEEGRGKVLDCLHLGQVGSTEGMTKDNAPWVGNVDNSYKQMQNGQGKSLGKSGGGGLAIGLGKRE